MSAAVRDTLCMYLDAGDGFTAPVLTRLRYEADDPFVVTMAFCRHDTVLAEWRFDRDMVADGLRRAVGEGRVRFGPRWEGHRHELRITLLGDEDGRGGERAEIVSWAPPVMAFLNRTYALVASGQEQPDFDAFLTQVLTEG
ncbi:SsgA family sporulation/cell division regulator [Streptomyces sp. NPDC090306]|uniref:SsgA family sporulation/cell division regulator n=1 Tax=unclassified Streptomyces TaxID=2593676 RepID=UPI0036EFE2B2